MSAKRKGRVMIEVDIDADLSGLEPGQPVALTEVGVDLATAVDAEGARREHEVSETVIENGRKFLVLRERSDA